MDCISPRLINTLRHARRPVRHHQMVSLYQDEASCYSDLDRLMAVGLVRLEHNGVRWDGS